MAIIELPIRNDIPSFSFRCDLDGETYTLSFRHNSRKNRWTMDILTDAGEAIVTGIALLVGANLINMYQDDRLPPGFLFVLNTKDENEEPNRDNFADDVKLLYSEAA